MSSETLNFTSELYQYYRQHSLREIDVLKKLRDKTHEMHGYQMQISPEQGQFMALLMGILGAKKTLDIGTFTGYSALVVALALPEDGKVITCDIDKDCTAVAKQFWEEAKAQHKIDLQLAPAMETLQKLLANGEGNTFDFIFIDADKTHYNDYYEQALALVRSGGLIAIDNVLWDGSVANPAINDAATQAIRALNTKLLHDERVAISMLPIGDGLTLARKR